MVVLVVMVLEMEEEMMGMEEEDLGGLFGGL